MKRMPEHIRRSIKEQSATVSHDHPKGNKARPNNDWPPKSGAQSGPTAKTAGAGKTSKDDAGATKGRTDKAKDDEAAQPTGK